MEASQSRNKTEEDCLFLWKGVTVWTQMQNTKQKQTEQKLVQKKEWFQQYFNEY